MVIQKTKSNKLPLDTIEALIETQYVYYALVTAAQRDIPNLPTKPYEQALHLAATQLQQLLKQHSAQLGQEKSKARFNEIVAQCNPTMEAVSE